MEAMARTPLQYPNLRLACAVTLSPMAAFSIFLPLVYFATSFLGRASRDIESLSLAFVNGALGGAVYGWPVMVIIGLPAHMLLSSIGLVRAPSYMAAGAVSGLIAFMAIAGLFADQYGVRTAEFPVFAILSILLGTLTAGIAWRIRRPDRLTTDIRGNEG